MQKLLLSLLIILFSFRISFSQKFAVIGDFGMDNDAELSVANLIKSWNPDFIISVGDNDYIYPNPSYMDKAIGKYFSDYIYPYKGDYGTGATENKFFPCLGNHDVDRDSGEAYFDYFTLPNNERYYDFEKGEIHFFVISSDSTEKDGRTFNSVQGNWIKNKLENSSSKWNIVFFHEPPYSSLYGEKKDLQWPFKEWGADIVLTGHCHHYERLSNNGFTYIINGAGGVGLDPFTNVLPQSVFRYNKNYGAQFISIVRDTLKFEFYSINNELIDKYLIVKPNEVGLTPNKNILGLQNFPNPFKETTTISFQLQKRSKVTFELFDQTGKLFLKKENSFEEGENFIYLKDLDLKAGPYYYRLLSKDETITKTCVLIK